MLSKIENLNLDDAEKVDAGIIVIDNVTHNYVIAAFEDRYEVYIYDDDSDTLVKGISKYLADAKQKAINELEK